MTSTPTRKTLTVLFIVLTILIVSLITSGVFALTTNRKLNTDSIEQLIEKNTLDDNVSIAGVNVSGLDEGQVRTALAPVIASWYTDKDIAFTMQRQPHIYNIKDIGISPNVEGAIKDAFLYSAKGTLPTDYTPASTLDNGLDFPIFPDVSLEMIHEFLQTEHVLDAVNITPDDAGVIFRPSVTDEQKRFQYEQPIPGLELNVDKFAPMILNAIKNNDYAVLTAPYDEVNAFSSIDDMRYKTQLIGTFTSKIKSRGEERVANITQLASLINQNISVIMPGDTVSLNDDCGERTLVAGFQEAPALNAGVHVYEVGGGVCQISSTLYIAALTAELAIPERQHHSLVSEYIDPGLDATISFVPDLKITNNNTSPIYISMVVDTDQYEVTCNIYGEPAAHGYTIEMLSKVYKNTLPDPATYRYAQISPGGVSIRPGRTYEYTPHTYGTRVKVYRQYKDADGNVVKSEFLHSDIYDAFSGEYYINPNSE